MMRELLCMALRNTSSLQGLALTDGSREAGLVELHQRCTVTRPVLDVSNYVGRYGVG
jgi:hypothetical protein